MDNGWTEEDQTAYDDGVQFGLMQDNYYPRAYKNVEAIRPELPLDVDYYIVTAHEFIGLLQERIETMNAIIIQLSKKEGE